MTPETAGARSVFEYIRRTAESVPGGYRWKTIDSQNNPHYHYDVFNGCGGISLFLAEYYRRTRASEALDLAMDHWETLNLR